MIYGKNINYNQYLCSGINENLNNALKRNLINIDLNEIKNIIDSVDFISDKRKDFYFKIIENSYYKELIPALKNILNKNKKCESNFEDVNLGYFYKNNIEKFKELDLFEKNELIIGNLSYNIMRVSNSRALLFDDYEVVGLISLRTKNKDIVSTIQCFVELGYEIKDYELLDYKNNDLRD